MGPLADRKERGTGRSVAAMSSCGTGHQMCAGLPDLVCSPVLLAPPETKNLSAKQNNITNIYDQNFEQR